MGFSPRINQLERNFIYNGDMRVSQRGDFSSSSAAANAAYYVDRWRSILEGGITGNKQVFSTSQPPGMFGSKSIRYTATSSATTRFGMWQLSGDANSVSSSHIDEMIGRPVTFGAWVKSNSPNARLFMSVNTSNNGESNAHSGGGGWELLWGNYTVDPAGITNWQFYSWLTGANATNVSISSGDYIETAGVFVINGTHDLSDGNSPFVPRNYEHELSLCQSFYERLAQSNGFSNMMLGFGYTLNASVADFVLYYHPKRRYPSSFTFAGGTFYIGDTSNTFTATLNNLPEVNLDKAYIRGSSSGMTQYRPCLFFCTSGSYVEINSEV